MYCLLVSAIQTKRADLGSRLTFLYSKLKSSFSMYQNFTFLLQELLLISQLRILITTLVPMILLRCLKPDCEFFCGFILQIKLLFPGLFFSFPPVDTLMHIATEAIGCGFKIHVCLRTVQIPLRPMTSLIFYPWWSLIIHLQYVM